LIECPNTVNTRFLKEAGLLLGYPKAARSKKKREYRERRREEERRGEKRREEGRGRKFILGGTSSYTLLGFEGNLRSSKFFVRRIRRGRGKERESRFTIFSRSGGGLPLLLLSL
jgi:hypothetical protein